LALPMALVFKRFAGKHIPGGVGSCHRSHFIVRTPLVLEYATFSCTIGPFGLQPMRLSGYTIQKAEK
jgi:hypothetical protein